MILFIGLNCVGYVVRNFPDHRGSTSLLTRIETWQLGDNAYIYIWDNVMMCSKIICKIKHKLDGSIFYTYQFSRLAKVLVLICIIYFGFTWLVE